MDSNPDPWDPKGPARSGQLYTQAGYRVFAFGEKHITVLTLGGTSSGSLTSELWRLLRHHGLGQRIHYGPRGVTPPSAQGRERSSCFVRHWVGARC